GQALIVADGPSVTGDPGQRPLYDPPAWQRLEGVQVIGPPDDFQCQLRLELARGPGDELAGVAAVGPGQLDRGEGPPQVPQQRPGGVAVLHRRGGDQHGEQQADRVDGEVPLGPVDLLARVVAAAGAADHLRAFYRLGIDDRRRRGARAPGGGPDPVA